VIADYGCQFFNASIPLEVGAGGVCEFLDSFLDSEFESDLPVELPTTLMACLCRKAALIFGVLRQY
jgi:hypothetical protein